MAEDILLEKKLQTFTRGQIVLLLYVLIFHSGAFFLFWLTDNLLFATLIIVGSVVFVLGVFIYSRYKSFTSVRVFEDRVEVVNRFLVNSSRRIEGSKIESIDYSQSLLGRSAYGVATIRGSGMATISLSPIQDPEAVAEAIRTISSKSAPKPGAPGPAVSDTAGSLAELISMKEQGHLTDEEFVAAKKKLLG